MLNEIDATRGPMQDLLDAAQKALNIWSKALDVLHAEFARRVYNPDARQRESLNAMAQRLLPMPPTTSKNDRDQFASLYLWKMIEGWAQRGAVYWEETWYRPWRGAAFKQSEKIVGLNDTQHVAILKLFGPEVPRGKYFSKPSVYPWYSILGYWEPLKRTRVDVYEDPPEHGHNV
jgi:hypothetical protein